MTRKQVMNGTKLLEAAEHLLYVLEVSKLRSHSLHLDDAMNQLKKYVDASREPLHIENGSEIEFPNI